MPASAFPLPDAQSTIMPVGSEHASPPFSATPPPPPPESFAPSQPSPYYTPYAPGQGQGSMPASSSYVPTPPSATAPAPSFARPQKDSSKGVLGQIGCGVLLVILLILGLCGGASYVGYRWITSQASGTNTDTGSTTGSNGSNTQDGTPTSSHVITKQINQTITYSGVDITIQNVQQASSFSDDNSSGSNGVVRINVKENNTAANGGSFAYSDTVRLILPDKSSVAPSNTLKYTSPQAQTTQANWWDFQVPTSVSVDQLTLQLGKSTEAQMLVPLTGKADVSQYQAKTIHPNAKTQYDGLNWTITTATKSWSASGQQAAQGMRYVVVTLLVDNPSSRDFNAYYGDYVRLKSGSSTSAPTSDSTLPLGFSAGSTGKTGSLIFIMPDSSSSFTLIFEGNANTTPPISQATIDFQIA